tara:strand:- start:383 stop:7828 length:7446 start_codon:yes stop_codon:yes gene_type:complete
MNEEEFITKLKDAASKMQADGIDPTQIQGFIDQKKNEWKTKSEGKTNAVAGEAVPAMAENQSDLDSQPLDTSLEQQETSEASKKTPVLVEEVTFFGENKVVDANELDWTDTFKVIKDPKTGDYGVQVPDFDLSFLKINDTEYNNDPETTTAAESLARTWNNTLIDQLSLTDDRFYNLSEQLFGDVESANFQVSKQAIDATESEQKETLRLEDIPTAFSEGGLIEGIAHTTAAVTNAISSVGASAIQAAATGGVGMAVDMVQGSVSEYTKARAEELGVSYEDASRKISSSELIIPVGLGTLSYKLEKMGLKGVGKAINTMSDSGKKALIQYVNSAGKEALTELSQGLVESWSTGFGAKNSFDDAAKSVSKFIEEEALETALQGAVGGAGSVGVGRGVNRLRAKNRSSQNEKSIKNSVQTIFDIDQKLNNPSTTEEQKTILRKQKLVEKQKVKNILTKEDELVNKLTKAEQKALLEKEYMLNGRKLQNRNEIVEMIANATDEDFMKASITAFGDSDLQEKLNFRRKSIIKNNKNAVRKKVQPKTFEESKSKVDEEIQKRKLQLSKISEEDGPLIAEALRTQIKRLEEAKKQINSHINYQLDELNETELFELTELDDEISLYEAVVNNPSYSEDAKASAKAELERLKNEQQNKFNATDSTDLANPEGPRKQKNVDLSRKTQEAYERGDTDGIIKAQGGMISSVATSLWSRIPADKQVGTYDGFKAALVSSKGGLLDLIGTYKPETGVPLAAWLGNKQSGLRIRANRIVKELTKQDIEVSTDSTEALNSFSSNEIDIDNINLGPKYNSQRLGLGVNLLNESANNVELGQVAIEKALAEADAKAETKGKTLSQKQRQTVSEKAFNKFFKDQYVQTVKDRMGKKLDLKDYIKNNVSTLKRIALSNIDFQMGTGITKDWNKYPPSDQVFQDYYEGTDTDNAQAISDRKKKLAEAVSDQIGKDAKDNYFEGKEAERAKIGEDLGVAYQLEEETDLDVQTLLKEIYSERADPKATEIDLEIDDQANYNKYMANEVVPNVDHKNTDPVNLNTPEGIKVAIKGLMEMAKKGFISAVHLGQMANFGRKEVEIKGVKYYELNAPSEGSVNIDGKILLKRPDEATRKSAEFYKTHEGKFKPTKGNAFYGAKDPNFIKLKQEAENNYKGEKIKKGGKLNLFLDKVNVIKNKIVDFATFKELAENHRPKAKNTQKIVTQMTIDFAKAVKSGANPYIAGQLLKSAYASTSGLVKTSYEFKGYENGILEFGNSEKFTEEFRGNSQRRVREEHSPPAGTFTGKLFKLAVVAPVERIEANVVEMYKDAGQYLVSFKHDEMIDNAGLASSIVEGTAIGRGAGIARLVAAGIPLEKITSVNGIVFADILKHVKGQKLAKVQLEAILAANDIERNIAFGIQLQEDNNPDPELSNSERQTALADILGAAFGINVVTTKEDAIQALIDANEFPNTPEGRVAAGKALERIRGFNAGESIYISEKKATPDTAMHELTHAWTRLVYKSKPELFDAIFEKLKSHPLYAEAVARMSKGSYAKLEPGSFDYKDEILAHILGKEGGTLFSLFDGDQDAKSLVEQFFDYVRETLGFDPTTKNFADLTVEQVVKLSVKDITEANPGANFDKLKNVAEGKSWYAKTEATQSPSAKAKSDPLIRALNKLKLSYRENKNLAQAINDAYNEVEGTMDFLEFARLIAKNTKEINSGKSKQLLVGKTAFLKAEKIAEESAKKNEEGKLSEEKGKKMADKLRAIIYGKTSKPSRWFIPPNAEDFKGLLYAFLPGGKAGVEAKKWLTETLLKPYSDAIAALDTEILNKTNAWKKLSKGFDFNKKVGGTPYTLGDAIKIYNGLKNDQDPNIAKKKHLDALIHAVESDGAVLDFANEVNESFPIDVTSGWQNRSFAKEIFDSINDGARKRHLVTFSANVDAIFTDATLDLIADQYGVKYKQALVSTLSRMKSGRNRVGTDASANSYMNWINRAVGTTMFLNTRSAFLQTLSSLNFINKPGNNLFQAMKAFGDQKQWKKDYNLLWNSDYLTNRRDGAKFDVLADEMSQGDVKGIEKLLKAGFLPTRYADSFAIAMGGAAFYRNRINMLTKGGMSQADAEAQAMIAWREAAEESQQSADPSKISEIQSSSIGKLIYAFANTPFQYARLTKRKLQDLTSGRSAAEGNVQKDIQSLLYYSVLQSVMFNALQGGLVALTMGNDPDDEELKDEKYAQILERTLTSYAKSIGNPGAVAATLYAMLKEGHMQQTGERRKDANVFALTATSISPPLNSKLKDLSAAYRAYNKIDENDLVTPSLDSDALTMAGETASFIGVPLDRVIKKTRHLAAITNEEVELWQRVWMLAGWSEWELGVNKKEANFKKPKFKKQKFKKPEFEKPEFEKTAFKRLENGVAGKANNDGTIEIDPNLSPVEREKTIAHEEKHMKDMESGKLAYDDDYVTWNGKKYERKDGNIIYKGKALIEGDPSLPWEKVAYAAEPSTSAVKRKLY